MEHLQITMPLFRKVSERALIIDDIWKIYDSEKEDNLRKKENWKRYIKFLKEKKSVDNENERKLFKKSKGFIKKLTPKQVAVKTAHLKKEELYYFYSQCKERFHKELSIGSYLLFNGMR